MTQSMEEKQLKMRTFGLQAAYLASCVLHDRIPQPEENMDLEGLYTFCKFHSITAAVAMGLEQVWMTQPAGEDVMKKWRQTRDKAIRKNILLNAERERILGYLDSIGCRYMPLKGSLIQFDYPRFGMRQMGDNDILVDADKSQAIYRFMLDSGYTAAHYNQGNHDEYIRQPIYNIEIHRSLFKMETAPVLAAYYRDVFDRAVKDAGNAQGYHLQDEDFYIYMTAHSYNHFRGSGVGLRHLMDVYVFTFKRPNLDWDYIEKHLEGLEALDFDRCCRYLSNALFASPTLQPQVEGAMLEALDAFCASGAFGTEEQLFTKALQKHTSPGGKFKHFIRRIFPPQEMLGIMYPSVRNRKWLVPFVWVYRLIRSVIYRPGRVLREFKFFIRKK